MARNGKKRAVPSENAGNVPKLHGRPLFLWKDVVGFTRPFCLLKRQVTRVVTFTFCEGISRRRGCLSAGEEAIGEMLMLDRLHLHCSHLGFFRLSLGHCQDLLVGPQTSIPSVSSLPASPALWLPRLLWKTAVHWQVNRHLQWTSMFID